MSTSGATLTVTKTAPPGPVLDRLMAQAAWLLEYRESPNFIDVLGTVDTGYVMPLLREPNWPLNNPAQTTHQVIEALAEGPWSHVERAPFDREKFLAYVHKFERPALSLWTHELLERLPERFERPFLTDVHGDATLENVLTDGDRVVLIDPIPDAVIDGKIPSVTAVDFGKLLQSALGYELVKFGVISRWQWQPEIAYEVRHAVFDDEEWELSKYFCALHVARFIPYQTPALHARWDEDYDTIVRFLRVIDARNL